MFALALEILVAILLVVTICYAMVLNRKLGSLRRGKEEMESLAASFGEATQRAEENFGKLRKTAEELHNGIVKAQALHDDLTFLIDRGNTVADQLEDKVREARQETGYMPKTIVVEKPQEKAPEEKAPEDEIGQAEANSDAERELLKALRAVR